jgi:hypothetical protein
LNENKTAVNPKKWTKGTVDRHGQITMYALMLFLKHDIAPEDLTIYLNYIRVIEGADMRYYLPNPIELKRFPTKRTGEQIAEYADYIIKTVDNMQKYIEERDTVKTPEKVNN